MSIGTIARRMTTAAAILALSAGAALAAPAEKAPARKPPAPAIPASGKDENARLKDEIRLLRDKLEEMETRLTDIEEKEPEKESEKSGDGGVAKLIEEKFGTLSIHGNLAGYIQPGGQADIQGERVKGESNAGFVANLDIEFEPIENGKVTLQLHAGEGDGADRLLVERKGFLLSDLNTLNDDNPDDQGVTLLQAYYTHEFMEKALVMSIGKTQPLGFLDQNAFANDEMAGFVGKAFVNNPLLDSENEFGPTLALDWNVSDALTLTAVAAATSRPNDAAERQKGNFENVFDTPFLGAQIAWKPGFFDKEGTYRLYGWTASYKRDSLATTGDVEDAQARTDAAAADLQAQIDAATLAGDATLAAQLAAIDPTQPVDVKRKSGWGVGVSFDQLLTDDFGVFVRAGYQERKTYVAPWFWSAGFNWKSLIPGREEDNLGFGVAGLVTRDDVVADGVEFDGGTEYHAELYYRAVLSENFAVGPHLQYVMNPLGRSENDDVVAGMLKAVWSF